MHGHPCLKVDSNWIEKVAICMNIFLLGGNFTYSDIVIFVKPWPFVDHPNLFF
jgi:hypothetical protein